MVKLEGYIIYLSVENKDYVSVWFCVENVIVVNDIFIVFFFLILEFV